MCLQKNVLCPVSWVFFPSFHGYVTSCFSVVCVYSSHRLQCAVDVPGKSWISAEVDEKCCISELL